MERIENIEKTIGKIEVEIVRLPEDIKVLAIDGRCGAGKTTLAGLLSQRLGCGVIHMDDFFLPEELRTPERLAEPGGNVHYERFAEEVLPGLQKEAAFRYRRFDCKRMALGEEVLVPSGKIRIVEGAYSCHPFFGEYMSLRIFCDIGPEEQLRRIRSRNGEEAAAAFAGKWIPMEERYFQAWEVEKKADILIGPDGGLRGAGEILS